MKTPLTLKTLMLSTSTVASIATSFFAVPAIADQSLLNGQYPTIAPASCSYMLMAPQNANSAYHSEDCQTVFILPPAVGTAQIVDFAPSENILSCAAVISSDNSVDALQAKKEKLSEELNNLVDAGSPRFNVLNDAITKLDTLIQAMSGNYSTIEGATLQTILSTGADETFRNEYLLANINLVHDGVAIEYAPISESVLSFNSTSTVGKDLQRSAVISIAVPGVSPIGSNTVAGNVLMNGSMSAQVRLSLEGACPAYRGKDLRHATDLTPDISKLNNYLTANLTYTVPVKTAYGYHASMKLETAASSYFSLLGSKAKFSIDEYVTSTQSGQVANPFTFVWDQYEVPNTPEATALAQDVIVQVENDLAKRLADELKTLGYLSVAEATPVAIPDAGVVNVPVQQRVCERKHIAFIDVGEECHDETVSAAVNIDGGAEEAVKKMNDTNFVLSTTVMKHTIMQRTHTSTFKFTK